MPDALFEDPRLARLYDPLVTFRDTTLIEKEPEPIVSFSTLRFRGRAGIEHSLREAGFTVDEARDAPDRPGRELVVIARRS